MNRWWKLIHESAPLARAHLDEAYTEACLDVSAPLARAQRGPAFVQAGDDRVSPARAGSTARHASGVGCATSQPRSRGLNCRTNIATHSAIESAPLARAQHGGLEEDGRGLRVSPARAGSTWWAACRPGGWTSQPRSRGLNLPDLGVLKRFANLLLALATRMMPYGLDARLGCSLPGRITPACAGCYYSGINVTDTPLGPLSLARAPLGEGSQPAASSRESGHSRLRRLFLFCMSLLSSLPSQSRLYEPAPIVKLNFEYIAEALPLAQARVNGEGRVIPARAGFVQEIPPGSRGGGVSPPA